MALVNSLVSSAGIIHAREDEDIAGPADDKKMPRVPRSPAHILRLFLLLGIILPDGKRQLQK